MQYEELLALVQQLSVEQKTSLRKELDKYIKDQQSSNSSRLKQLALSAPIMSDAQFTAYQEFRKQFSSWRGE